MLPYMRKAILDAAKPGGPWKILLGGVALFWRECKLKR
jgi:hypothetical protein